MRVRDLPDREREPQEERAEAPAPPLAHAQLIALQRGAGNAAVTGMLARQEGATAEAETAEAESEGPVGGPKEVAPEEPQAEPKHPGKPKLKMDLASGEKILTDTFGKVKTIVQGTIEVLDPADFKKAYDKIYGGGQWSWDTYVVPTYGSLNGFAHNGVNYINKGSAGLHTVVHEMLHNNTAADWRGVVGSRWDEGVTEVLTQEACKKFSVDAPVCYPGESPVVREAISTGLSVDDLATAYLTGGAQTLVADWCDANCAEDWAAIKGYMEAKDWNAAKAAVKKKKSNKKGLWGSIKSFFGGS
jgi:hypothetical protein